MSERTFTGIVQVEDAGLTGMVALRADLADAAVVKALSAAGIAVPNQGQKLGDAFWMSPDELMILCAYETAEAQVAGLSKALSGMHHLALNVSDARVLFRLHGPGAALRETLAKLTPSDLRPKVFGVGSVRRTRLAQVPAAFWLAEPDVAELICFRSVADYVFGLLSHAAAPGSEVGYFQS